MKRLRLLDTMALAVSLSVSGSSCAKVLYDGPRRPSEAVAKLTSSDGPDQTYCRTKILKVDGKTVRDGTFELLPGLHSVEVESRDKSSGALMFVPAVGLIGGALIGAAMGSPRQVTSGPTTACFKAKAGHTYVVQSYGARETFQLELLDDETSTDVKDFCQ